jgi:hypothetical protein
MNESVHLQKVIVASPIRYQEKYLLVASKVVRLPGILVTSLLVSIQAAAVLLLIVIIISLFRRRVLGEAIINAARNLDSLLQYRLQKGSLLFEVSP